MRYRYRCRHVWFLGCEGLKSVRRISSPKKLRGCASFDSMTPNSSTALAPAMCTCAVCIIQVHGLPTRRLSHKCLRFWLRPAANVVRLTVPRTEGGDEEAGVQLRQQRLVDAGDGQDAQEGAQPGDEHVVPGWQRQRRVKVLQ